MNDLPELPFEKIIGYLSLEDRLRSRGVSRRWYKVISSFKPTTLSYAELKAEFIKGKSRDRLFSGGLGWNFIRSRSIESFLNTFGQSVLSNLKHLRLFELDINEQNKSIVAQALNSFGQLENLGLFRLNSKSRHNLKIEFELNLPTLRSVQLSDLFEIKKLTLDAPKLQTVQFNCPSTLRLNIVHVETVERLFSSRPDCAAVKKLKNLKCLYATEPRFDSTILSTLEQLNEVHLYWTGGDIVAKLFEEKKRLGRTDLKIFYFGLLLNAPDSTKVIHDNYCSNQMIANLAENFSRLPDEIPFCDRVFHSAIERVTSELAVSILSRFTDLSKISVYDSVQDIERFLNFLKNYNNITALSFHGDQPADLFERLPDHCAVQVLFIDCSIDVELIRRILGLQFVSHVSCKCSNRNVEIDIIGHLSKRFQVTVKNTKKIVADVSAVIQFITEQIGEKKRKAEVDQPLAKSVKKN